MRRRIFIFLVSMLASLVFLEGVSPWQPTLGTTPATDPLPSWNDGAAKQAIVEFVQTTTNQASKQFVPLAERIATFDQDGTLWVEHPMYTQVTYCLERLPAVVKAQPKLANVEPFQTVISGDREAIAKLSEDDRTLAKIFYGIIGSFTFLLIKHRKHEILASYQTFVKRI